MFQFLRLHSKTWWDNLNPLRGFGLCFSVCQWPFSSLVVYLGDNNINNTYKMTMLKLAYDLRQDLLRKKWGNPDVSETVYMYGSFPDTYRWTISAQVCSQPNQYYKAWTCHPLEAFVLNVFQFYYYRKRNQGEIMFLSSLFARDMDAYTKRTEKAVSLPHSTWWYCHR